MTEIRHAGQYTPEQLAARSQPTDTALERIRGQLNPRLRENDSLRAAIGPLQRAIGPLEQQVNDQRQRIAERGPARTSAARTAAQRARVELGKAERALTAARGELQAARQAYERQSTELEAEVARRLGSEAPGALQMLREVRAEALIDHEAYLNGPPRDVIEAYGAPRTLRRFANDWNPFGTSALDFEGDARSIRMSESDRSITIYQRMRQNYERLHPRASVREPYDPDMPGD